jgi:hypothetical protein
MTPLMLLPKSAAVVETSIVASIKAAAASAMLNLTAAESGIVRSGTEFPLPACATATDRNASTSVKLNPEDTGGSGFQDVPSVTMLRARSVSHAESAEFETMDSAIRVGSKSLSASDDGGDRTITAAPARSTGALFITTASVTAAVAAALPLLLLVLDAAATRVAAAEVEFKGGGRVLS